jgi:hypothetical protein
MAVIAAAQHPPGHIVTARITRPIFRRIHLRKKHEEAKQHESDEHVFHWEIRDVLKVIPTGMAGKGEVPENNSPPSPCGLRRGNFASALCRIGLPSVSQTNTR